MKGNDVEPSAHTNLDRATVRDRVCSGGLSIFVPDDEDVADNTCNKCFILLMMFLRELRPRGRAPSFNGHVGGKLSASFFGVCVQTADGCRNARHDAKYTCDQKALDLHTTPSIPGITAVVVAVESLKITKRRTQQT